MTDSIQTGDIKNNKGIAIGPGATVSVTEIHLPADDTPTYQAPPLPPYDTLPDVGDLPPGSRPVHGRYAQFTGREEELLDLAAALLFDEAQNTAVTAQPIIASGMGGIGKTQLAVEFMYRYGRFFSGGVYWMSFSDPAAIGAEIATCIGALSPAQQATFHTLDLPTQERWVRMAWQKPISRLLIFDNLDDENALRLLAEYRPKTGGCRLLVTSRREVWPNELGATIRPVRTLPRRDSIALLQELIYPNASTEIAADDLDGIAEALGDLPLALHLAGSYLFAYRRTVTSAAYLARLTDPILLSHPSLTGEKTSYSPTGHELSVAHTLALSYERLDADNRIDGLALALLGRLAYFSPAQAVPLALLIPSLRSGMFAVTEMDDPTVDDALRRLSMLGLIEQDTDSAGVLVHRLISAFVREQPENGTPQADVEQTLLSKAAQLNQEGYPRELLPWQIHLHQATNLAVSCESENAAELCNELGYHLKEVGDYAAARPYYERALTINEKAQDPDRQNTALLQATAVNLNNLGYLLQAMGDYVGARPYYEQALATRQKALGSHHPDTAQSLNNLGHLLQTMEDYVGARLYYEQALIINQKALGSDHPATAQNLHNLGFLLHTIEDYDGAQSFYEQALTIRKKVFGPNHPSIASSLNNLGHLLQTRGDYAEARTYYEQALAINQKALGPDHPNVAGSLNNLGALLQAMGNNAKARQYYQRALAICEMKLGANHRHTKLVRGKLQSLS